MKKVNFSGRFGSCLGEDLVVGGVRKCVEMRGGQAFKSSPLRNLRSLLLHAQL